MSVEFCLKFELNKGTINHFYPLWFFYRRYFSFNALSNFLSIKGNSNHKNNRKPNKWLTDNVAIDSISPFLHLANYARNTYILHQLMKSRVYEKVILDKDQTFFSSHLLFSIIDWKGKEGRIYIELQSKNALIIIMRKMIDEKKL